MSAPTVMAEGVDAGEKLAAFALELPAATINGIPRLTAESTASLREAE